MVKGVKRLAASAKAVDPTLDALFSSSAGPVKAPVQSRYTGLLEKKQREAPKPPVVVKDDRIEEDEGDDEVLSEISEELDYGDDDEEDESESDNQDEDQDEDEGEGDESETSDQDQEEEEASDEQILHESIADVPMDLDTVIQAVEGDQPKRERKRKRKEENDGLEGKYYDKLTAEDEEKPADKRQKNEEDAKDAEAGSDEDGVLVHESLAKEDDTSDLEKAARTVFLANVSTEAISSKSARKTLLAHLSSSLDKDASPPQKIESIRFRSLAFATGSMPKRAAFITKSLMEATTKSANAYAVYSTTAAARKAATDLNGTEVLGRHIRVDSVAHPSPTDHRRCLFVGNLGFVDDETVINTDAAGKNTEKKRNKVPSDIEEGLWRTFGKHGRVENVRVIRDPKTRVGKGFAYVQFYDGNDIETALLLDGKKFPPMLPRALRVTRAKDPRKTALAQERSKAKQGLPERGNGKSMKYKPKATPEQQSMAGRASRLLGRAGAAQQRHGKKPSRHESRGGESRDEQTPSIKAPESFIFEGRRASSKDTNDLKLNKKKKNKVGGGRPQNRGAKRAAEWKKKST